MPGIKVAHLAAIAFALFAPAMSASPIAASVSYSLLYERIDTTEPVIINLEFANHTGKPLVLNLGWDQRDQIYFSSIGPSGLREIHEPPPTTFDQIGRFGEVEIPPNSTHTQEIILSDWAAFDVPGQYAIELHLRGLLGLEDATSLQVQAERVALTVESDAAPLVQKHCAEEWQRLRDAKDGGDAFDASLFLGKVRNPIAVPLMSAALSTEHSTAIGGILITGLERIPSLSAVQALAAAMSGSNRQNARFAHDALARIQPHSSDPQIAREARLALDARDIPKQ